MLRQIYSRTSAGRSVLHRDLSAMLVSVAGSGLLGLLLAGSGCSSDSTSSGSGGKGGSSTSTGGSSADGGQSSAGESSVDSSGGAESDTVAEGGAAANGGVGGSSSGSATMGGKPSGGSASGGNTGSGGGIWGCVEAGGVCICQNDTDKEHESVCTGTYKCCVTVPFAGAIRCQCQDPGNQKCEAPAGTDAKVVDKCPPP